MGLEEDSLGGKFCVGEKKSKLSAVNSNAKGDFIWFSSEFSEILKIAKGVSINTWWDSPNKN